MSDLKLFRISDGTAEELTGGAVALESTLQTIIENNMETLFGVQFLAREFTTGPKHGGRIDSLGLDENGSPVIFEYKRAVNENVINQGLFYLDWLMDHRGDFTMLVQTRLGRKVSADIDWSAPRLVCVASDFTRYDEHAIDQMGRSIELVRYRDFTEGFLTLDLVSSTAGQAPPSLSTKKSASQHRKSKSGATVTELLAKASPSLKSLYSDLDIQLQALGDDVTMTTRKLYFAYRRIKNFACVEVHPSSATLLLYVKINPDTLELSDGFTRDVRNIGHFGTGDLEIKIKTNADLEKALPLVQTSYAAS